MTLIRHNPHSDEKKVFPIVVINTIVDKFASAYKSSFWGVDNGWITGYKILTMSLPKINVPFFEHIHTTDDDREAEKKILLKTINDTIADAFVSADRPSANPLTLQQSNCDISLYGNQYQQYHSSLIR